MDEKELSNKELKVNRALAAAFAYLVENGGTDICARCIYAERVNDWCDATTDKCVDGVKAWYELHG